MAWHWWAVTVAVGVCVAWAQGAAAGGGADSASVVTVDGAPPAGTFRQGGRHVRCVPSAPAHYRLRETGALCVEAARLCPGGAPMQFPICQLDAHLACKPTMGWFVGQNFSAGPGGVTDPDGALHAWAQGVDAAGLLQGVRDANAHRCTNLARVIAGKGQVVTWPMAASTLLASGQCEAWVHDRCAEARSVRVVLPTGEDITWLCRG